MKASRRSVKGHQSFRSIGSSLSTGFQVCLSKCCDPYVSSGCMIRLVFFCGLFALFQYFDLVTTLLKAGFQVYLSYPWFCVHSLRQQDTICWELNLISGFFAFVCLSVLADGINKCGWCLAGGRGCRSKGLKQVPRVSWILNYYLHFPIYQIFSLGNGIGEGGVHSSQVVRGGTWSSYYVTDFLIVLLSFLLSCAATFFK